MGSQDQGKLNWLQHNLPEGLVVDSGWLERHNVSRQLRRKYVLNGWLLTLARGVYCRPTAAAQPSALPWQQLVISLNALLNLPVAAGGRTSLELQDFSHYVAASDTREAHLFSNEHLPGWVSCVDVNTKLVLHSARKLFRGREVPTHLTAEGAPSSPEDSGFTEQTWGHWKHALPLSTPERAILELLNEVPKSETFHQADVLMEGMRNLSPRRLQGMLADCRSIKVKRLFLWFAEHHNHAWLQKLDRSSIDLGKGKRMLVRGGKLDTKYNITVPVSLHGSV